MLKFYSVFILILSSVSSLYAAEQASPLKKTKLEKVYFEEDPVSSVTIIKKEIQHASFEERKKQEKAAEEQQNYAINYLNTLLKEKKNIQFNPEIYNENFLVEIGYLASEYASSAKQYVETIKTKKNEIQENYKQILAEQNKELPTEKFNKLENQHKNLNEKFTNLNTLQKIYQTNQKFYEDLVKKINDYLKSN